MLGWPLLHCARKEGFSGLECVWERLPETPLIRAQCCSVQCSQRCWHKACADPLTVAQTSQHWKHRGRQHSATGTGTMCDILPSSFCLALLSCFVIYSSVKIQHSKWFQERSSLSWLSSLPFYLFICLLQVSQQIWGSLWPSSKYSVQQEQQFASAASLWLFHPCFQDVVCLLIFVVNTTHKNSSQFRFIRQKPINHPVRETPAKSN